MTVEIKGNFASRELLIEYLPIQTELVFETKIVERAREREESAISRL